MTDDTQFFLGIGLYTFVQYLVTQALKGGREVIQHEAGIGILIRHQ